MEKGLVSIIMPAFNAEKYIESAIESVLAQTYKRLELIIVNDGSTDTTKDLALKYSDERLKYIETSNGGVSTARNHGLEQAKGEFFCFLDSDDLMPPESISSRIEVFKKNRDAVFVGGAQYVFEGDITHIIKKQEPRYNGPPTKPIAILNSKCFINCGTWLIRRQDQEMETFPVGWTHLEDACFFLKISSWGIHYSTSSPAQYYRKHDSSAMTNLNLLAKGYFQYLKFAKAYLTLPWQIVLKLKIMKIMTLSYLKRRELRSIVEWNLRYLSA